MLSSEDQYETVMPKPSLPEPAVAAGVPMLAACLRNSTQPPDAPAPLAVCWVGDAAFLPHSYALLALRRIDAHLAFAPVALTASDRKPLAASLDAEVRALFTPMA
jgi:hypothetical protein